MVHCSFNSLWYILFNVDSFFSSSLLWHGCGSCLSLISLTGFQNSQVFHIPVRRIPDSEDEIGWFLLIRTSGDMGKVTRNTLLLYSDYKALGCYNIVSLRITNIIYCYTRTWTWLGCGQNCKKKLNFNTCNSMLKNRHCRITGFLLV